MSQVTVKLLHVDCSNNIYNNNNETLVKRKPPAQNQSSARCTENKENQAANCLRCTHTAENQRKQLTQEGIQSFPVVEGFEQMGLQGSFKCNGWLYVSDLCDLLITH